MFSAGRGIAWNDRTSLGQAHAALMKNATRLLTAPQCYGKARVTSRHGSGHDAPSWINFEKDRGGTW
jgi:hypothetical protein